MSTWIQSFLKLNIFCPESGEQFQSKAVSVTWFTGFVWTEGWFELKKIKIRFPEKYSNLRGASLKILSIKASLKIFKKYNVIYSTFTEDYFFSLFYSLIFLLWISITKCSPQIAVRSTVLSRNQSINTFDLFAFSELSFSLYF